MRLHTLVLWLLLSAVIAPGAAGQEATSLRRDGNGVAALRKPVSVDFRGTPLRTALREVSERAGLALAFPGDLPDLDAPVTFRARGAPAAEVLLRLLEGSGLEVRVFPSGQLVLVRGDAPPRPRAPVAGPPLAASDTGRLRTVTLAEIVVTPGRFGVGPADVASSTALSREDLETAPQLGEDVFRMMSRLPGVTAGDYSARFSVRGGANEEVLVLLDGLELVEPFHLKDFDGALSIVDGEALGGVDLTTGGFTAEYGDRLTGVFEMRTSNPPPGKPRAEAGISLSNARFLGQGGFASGKGQWLLSARRGYLDVILKLIHEDDDVEPRYGDVLAKLQYQPGANHIVSIHGLYAADRLRFRDEDFAARSSYDNLYGWVNWRARFGERLSVRSVASTGDLSWDRTGEQDGPDPEVRVSDRRGFHFAGVKQHWSWEGSDRFLARWGWELQRSDAAYDYSSQHRRSSVEQGRVRTRTDSTRILTDPAGRELGVYLTGRARAGEAFTAEAGIRFDQQTHTKDRSWSPRLNLAYEAGARTTVRGAWGIFYQSQGIHELQVQDGVTSFHPAERAEHRIVSVEQRFRRATLRAEAYQRRLAPVRPRFHNLERFIEPFPEVEDDRVLLRPEHGEARGLELFVQRAGTGSLRWSASYALARVHDEYAEGTVPREVDQRHTVQLTAAYVPSTRWRMSAAWQFHSGWPITARVFRSDTLAGGAPVVFAGYGPLYAERLPAYHRLDARVTRYWSTRHGRGAAFLDVYNLYDRANPQGYEYTVTANPTGKLDVRRARAPLLPILPSVGLSWEF